MLRVGKLPDGLRGELESDGVLDVAESLAVVVRFSGSVPGLHSGTSVYRTAGALVFTPRRVVATLATRSNPAVLAVDRRWDAADDGPMTIEISADGVTLDLDVRRVDASFQGHLSLHYGHDVSTDALTRMPRTSLHQNVSPEFVRMALGVRGPKK